MSYDPQTTGFFTRLIRHEAFAGVLMMLAAAAALILANSGLSDSYHGVLGTKFTVTFGDTGLSKPLLLWINDGLMAIFFFLIGLELKREMLEGRLKNPRDVLLPGVAAIGGMNAAQAGIEAMMDGRYPGKIVIFPQIPELPLMGLDAMNDH